MHTRRWIGVWLVWLLAVGAAHGQVTPAEKAAAEALFDRGLTLMREGKLPDACASFEQSQAIERGIGTREVIADVVAFHAARLALRGIGEHEFVGFLDRGNALR